MGLQLSPQYSSMDISTQKDFQGKKYTWVSEMPKCEQDIWYLMPP